MRPFDSTKPARTPSTFPRSPKIRRIPRGKRPLLEVCEDRLLLSTYVVQNTNATGPGSLAQAIDDSNGNTTQANFIRFSITGSSQTINLTAPLSTITQPVTIDGTTQSGYAGKPIVELVGSAGATDGLNVTAAGVKIKGLVLNRFSDAAIILGGAGGDSVISSYVGTNVAGTAAGPGNGTGIRVSSPNNTIGGIAAGSANVISGNTKSGVDAGGTASLIVGNMIGTDPQGTKAIPNSTGISIGGSNVTVGGTVAAARNLISGNGGDGIGLSSTGTVIEGNYIGVDATGTKALPNPTGIEAVATTNLTIGGIAPGAGNLISGNTSSGINIHYNGFDKNITIQGNLIGTNSAGLAAIPNATGLYLQSTTNALVGGTDPAARNIISGNSGVGLVIDVQCAVTVQGNGIGVDATGNPLGNGLSGITVASPSTIGGTAAGAGNVISNNNSSQKANTPGGLLIQAGATSVVGNQIEGNKGPGVVVQQTTQVSILSNSIDGNLGQGIFFNTAAGQPNPNNLLPAPYLTSVFDAVGGQKTLTGIVLPNQANTSGYRVQFFANASYAADGTTGGKQFLGEVTKATNASSRAPFTFTYTPVSGLPVLSATVTDASGNTSQFSVRPPAPVNLVPAVQTIDENSSLTLSNNNGTAFLVTYANDAGTNSLQFTLTAGHGTIQLGSTTNLMGSGNGTNSLAYSGTLNDINNALDGVVYTPTQGYNGNDQLTIATNNLAGAELGGNQIATNSTAIVIQPLVDSPTVTAATTTANTETTSGLVITPGSATTNAAYFKITNVTGGSLFLADGTTAVAPGSFITVAQGAAGLKFAPSTNFVGQATFTVQSSTSATDAGLVGTTGTGSIAVNQFTSTVTLSGPTGSVAFGQSVTLTATVAPSAATGTVTFLDGSTSLGTGTLSGGSATLTLSTLVVGNHAITAQYGGDAITHPGTSASLTVTVGKGATTTALAAPTSPVDKGSAVTFTATVSPSAATGTVTFLEGSAVLGTGTLSGGVASFSTSALAVGTHAVTARYEGDASDAASTSAAQSVAVRALATTTALAASAASVTAGQSVTFTATVAPAAATGTVTFKEGTTTLGTGTLAAGVASFSTSALSIGVHDVTASYGGDATYATSASTAVAVAVVNQNASATTTTLAVSPSSAAVGQPVTFTATVVASPSGTPTGTVTFVEGTTTLGTATLSGGSATLTLSTLAAGSHSVVAQYAGTSSFNASVSAAQPVTVGKATTTTALAAPTSPVDKGSAVTFTATVSPSAATGTVTFLEGSAVLGTGTLSGGVASFSTSALAVGTHAVTARYEGDASDAASTSAPAAVTVVGQSTSATTTTLTASSGSTSSSVTFTATVAPAAASGTVTFQDGATVLGTGTLAGGVATFSTSALAAGVHNVTASYGGDATYKASVSAPLAVDVLGQSTAATTTTLTVSPASTAAGQPVTFTSTVSSNLPGSATGAVIFVEGTTTLGAATLTNGTATFTTTALSPGAHSVVAQFAGSSVFNPSVSAAQAVTVTKAPTATTLDPVGAGTVGQPVSFTAHVSPQAASGVVSFLEGSTVLGTGTLAGGAANFSTSSLGQGQHVITARYEGDSSYLTSTATTSDTLTINPASTSATTTTTTLTTGTTTVAANQAVTFNVTVTPATASGVVSFTEGSTVLGSTFVSGGSGAFTTTLPAGSNTVVAHFAGVGGSYGASDSAPLSITVAPADVTTTVGAPDPGTVAFVSTLYHEVLGRAPEATGLASWLQHLATDMTPANVSIAFFQSAERQALTAEHRAPRITQPRALADALQAKLRAEVPSAVLADPGPIAFVTTLYREILGREPEPSGQLYWLERLAIGTTPAQAAHEFEHSIEHRALQREHRAPKIRERTALADALKAETQAVRISAVTPTGPLKLS